MVSTKLPFVKTTTGEVFVLHTFGMVSKVPRHSNLQRFVARSEVRRCLDHRTRTDQFQGDQFWPKNLAFTRFQPNKWGFEMDGKSASFGCQRFSMTATKTLAKWAGVTNL